MSTLQFVTLLLVQLAAAALLAWLLLRQRAASVPEELLRRLTDLESSLAGAVAKANADLAARVAEVKGDVRADLADRLQTGMQGVRETVDRQFADGRAEQAHRLGETVAALEQKFDALRQATEGRLEQLGDRQSLSLREARQELGLSLKGFTESLQARFDKLTEGQESTSREARTELSRALAETTRVLAERMQGLEVKTALTLDGIRAKVDERLQAVSDQVQQKLEKNIQEGFAHFQKVQEHLRAAEEQLRNVGAVGQSINELNNLLKLPHLRGKFGEAELGRLLADFLPAPSFEEQVIIVPGSKEAVDAVVKFPSHRLPIDSKFNREQILPLFETSDPQRLAEARAQLAVVIKQQARSINEKYIHPEHGTTDLALMFLPSETVYFEVIRDMDLCAALHKQNVFPVSPNTLAITLKAIAMSVAQYDFAQGVKKTLEQIRAAQFSFGQFQKKFDEVGKGIEKAQTAYSTAAGHLNRYSNRVVKLTGEGVPEIEEGTPTAETET